MKEIVRALLAALDQGQDVIWCGIVEHSGSAPRSSGARMLVLPDRTISGSVGGGMAEAACIRKAQTMLETGETFDLLSFDLSSAAAAAAGMICGGAVRVILQRITPAHSAFFRALLAAGDAGERPVLLTIMSATPPLFAFWDARQGTHPGVGLDLRHVSLPENLMAHVASKAKTRNSFHLEEDGVRVFAEPLASPGTVHLFGAGHVALATARAAAFVGFEVVVLDDREEFANAARFPDAREVRLINLDARVSDFGPDDYVIIVTRGHLHDRDVLAQVLRTRAGYVGMIGSRTKRDGVYRSLLEAGFTEADLSRVFCPIGLDIGADTPEEIAISIVAEMIQVRAGRPCGHQKI